MKMVNDRSKKNELSIKPKKNGYYIARLTLCFGRKKGTRLEASGTSEEQSFVNFLNKYINYVESEINSGNITYSINNSIKQFLHHLLCEYNILSTDIDSKIANILTNLSNINNSNISNISTIHATITSIP